MSAQIGIEMFELDAHTHILPGIDDGAQTVPDSLALLEQLSAQQTGAALLTPHFDPASLSLDAFLQRRGEAMRRLQAALLPHHPAVAAGAEVALTRILFSNPGLERLCPDGIHMLVELPYDPALLPDAADMLGSLLWEHDIIPVLAHVERYPALLRNKPLFEDLIAAGCLTQINADTLLSRLHRSTVLRLLQSGKIHLLGSDCHSLTRRPVRIGEAVALLEKREPKQLHEIRRRSAALLAGLPSALPK